MATKSLRDWEKEKNFMIRDTTDDTEQLTEAEFMSRVVETGFYTVNHDERTEFLTANNYELTRENYMDSNLSSRRGYVEQMARETKAA